MLRALRAMWIPAASALCVVLGLAACGTAPGPPPGPAITLALSRPADLSRVSASVVTVRGTVKPARARVQVLGRAVHVAADGDFSTQVALSVGTNLIDVEASAPRSAGAVTAVRVVRFLLVTVPQVSGESPARAAAALKALGLEVKTQSASDPLSFLIPAPVQVCATTPLAGARVDPGTTVTLHTSKLCGF